MKALTGKMMAYKDYANTSVHRHNMKLVQELVNKFLDNYNNLEVELKAMYKPEYLDNNHSETVILGASGVPIKIKNVDEILEGMRVEVKVNMGYLSI